ncbi:MAG: hypothetical protein WBA07_08915 [Rivularia sp. (in: cyanobacteria)]
MFKSDKFPHSSYIRVPTSSFLITTTVFVVFVLDMASSGYGSFAFINNLQPTIATLTTDIRSAEEKLTHSEPSIPLSGEIQTNSEPLCRTLLDAYKKDVKCRFKPKSY